ncbi:MAG: winged helix-turn-helix domain-containing protein [Candidatus Thorarchaeota archaeon]
MIDAQFAFIEVKTDGRQDHRQLVKILGGNPMIYVLLPLTTGDYVLHAHFIGASRLLELGSFIRKVEGVIDVKIHPTMADLGSKMELSSLQLRVMPWLLRDPRMSVNDIARNSGLTTRRVRRIINDLLESESINFSFYWNPNAEDSMAFIAKIE